MNLTKFLQVPESVFSRRDWFFAALLFLVTIIAYSPAWNGTLIWDDDEHLTKPELQSVSGLGQIWTHLGSTRQYYPLVHTVFWIEHRVWGDSPLYYHLVNVALHVAAALLLVKILRTLQIPGAWLAGAIFALHPVQVESVAWMSELKNTLSAVFFLSSILTYLVFDQKRNRLAYFMALALFALGLLAKSVIAILPAALLVILWWKRGALSWKRDFRPLIPFFLVAIASGLFTAWVEQRFVGAQGDAFRLSMMERVLIAGRVVWFYLAKLYWPANLTFIYPRWNVTSTVWWQYLFPLATLVLLLALWMLRRKSRGPLAAFLFFVGMLFPVLGFLNVYPFVYSFVADHFEYLACIGIITLACAGLARLGQSGRLWIRRSATFVCGLILAALTVLTWRQAHMYCNAETLWQVTLARNPECWMAHNNLANIFLKTGRVEQALPHYEQTLALRPDLEKARYNLALAFSKKGRTDDAIEQYRKALETRPAYAEAHNNLAELLLRKGEVEEAINQYQEAIKLNPENTDAYKNLGAAFLQIGSMNDAIVQYGMAARLRPNDPDIEYNLANALAKDRRLSEAIIHYQKAVDLRPGYVEAEYELGSALFQSGQPEAALERYEEVLKVQPNYEKAHTNLGNLLLQTGDIRGAIAHYQRSLEIAPENTAALINLAWVLATCSDPSLRNGAQAVEVAERANKLSKEKNPFALRSLAAAYAEAGDFAKAIEAANRALELSSEQGTSALAKALAKEMEFYRAGSPYRKNSN
jgi:protein O-mannosyl-transferase